MSAWNRPEPLAGIHDTSHFDCGDPVLEACLRDPAAYAAAVLFVAGHIGVHVTPPTCGPPAS